MLLSIIVMSNLDTFTANEAIAMIEDIFLMKNKINKNLHCDHNYKNKTSTKAL